MDIEAMGVKKVVIDKPRQLMTGSYTSRMYITSLEMINGFEREVTNKITFYSDEPIVIQEAPSGDS